MQKEADYLKKTSDTEAAENKPADQTVAPEDLEPAGDITTQTDGSKDSVPGGDIKEDAEDSQPDPVMPSAEIPVIAEDSEETAQDASAAETETMMEESIPEDSDAEGTHWEFDPAKWSDENGNEVTFDFTPESIAEAYARSEKDGDAKGMEKYRALHELLTLKNDLELGEGDADTPQIGGYHKNVRGKIPGFESHHIPAQSVQDGKADELPAIAITAEDHRHTDSYRGKSHRKYQPFLPDGAEESESYKQEAEGMIESGNYVDLVRDEIYNLRDQCGTRYDGAIKQYLNTMAAMIAEKGVPGKK